MFESGGSDANTKYYNNVCLGKQEIDVGYDDYNGITAAMQKNGWSNHLTTGVGADDYLSLDEDDAMLPRDIYGGLPRKFARLATDSKLIDKGNASFEDDATSNVGKVWKQLVEDFPFLKRNITGTARDLGPYERPDNGTGITSVAGGNPADKGVRKYLSNGRIVILKNGVRYSLQGQKLYQK